MPPLLPLYARSLHESASMKASSPSSSEGTKPAAERARGRHAPSSQLSAHDGSFEPAMVC